MYSRPQIVPLSLLGLMYPGRVYKPHTSVFARNTTNALHRRNTTCLNFHDAIVQSWRGPTTLISRCSGIFHLGLSVIPLSFSKLFSVFSSTLPVWCSPLFPGATSTLSSKYPCRQITQHINSRKARDKHKHTQTLVRV